MNDYWQPRWRELDDALAKCTDLKFLLATASYFKQGGSRDHYLFKVASRILELQTQPAKADVGVQTSSESQSKLGTHTHSADEADASVQSRIESHQHSGSSDTLPASAGEGVRVQGMRESQDAVGPTPSTQSDEKVIQASDESHSSIGHLSSPPILNGGVQREIESQNVDGASIQNQDHSREVHLSREDSQNTPGLPAATPIPKKKPFTPPKPSAAALAREAQEKAAAAETKATIQDGLEWYKFKRLDGVAWMDTGRHELAALGREGEAQMKLARVLERNIPEPRNKFEKLKNLITFKQFKEFQAMARAEAA